MVIDNTQMRMTAPCLHNTLVEHTRNSQSLLGGRLVALSIIACSVVFLSTVGSRNKVQHSIIALAQLNRIGVTGSSDILPHFRLHIG